MNLPKAPKQYKSKRARKVRRNIADDKNLNQGKVIRQSSDLNEIPKKVIPSKVKRRRLSELDKIHENIQHVKEFNDLMKVNVVRACRERNANSNSFQDKEAFLIIENTFTLQNIDETIKIARELLSQYESEEFLESEKFFESKEF